MNIEKEIQELHERIKSIFGESVSVHIFVNSEGINVEPKYNTNRKYTSMQMINGKWVQKSKAEGY